MQKWVILATSVLSTCPRCRGAIRTSNPSAEGPFLVLGNRSGLSIFCFMVAAPWRPSPSGSASLGLGWRRLCCFSHSTYLMRRRPPAASLLILPTISTGPIGALGASADLASFYFGSWGSLKSVRNQCPLVFAKLLRLDPGSP
jgi:hypothetical protein